jgi:hypothetical protein
MSARAGFLFVVFSMGLAAVVEPLLAAPPAAAEPANPAPVVAARCDSLAARPCDTPWASCWARGTLR